MADALVTIALENLTSMLQNELKLLAGVTKELRKLSSTFAAIGASIADAEQRQMRQKYAQAWLAKLKDVAYDVDDVLDKWKTEQLIKLQVNAEGTSKVHCLLSPCFLLYRLQRRRNIGHMIKDINNRLDALDNEKRRYGFIDNERRVEIENRETGSQVNESNIVGRDEDEDKLLELLLGETSEGEPGVPVISIIGMGGIGKTTLAQKVFNNKRVVNEFPIRMWVCVSDDFDVKRLTKLMIESAGSRCGSPNLEPLQNQLRDMLAGKRCMLVLDDVWSQDSESMERLMVPLRNGPPGCRVLLTTRHDRVANAVGATYKHNLGVLSDDDCWLLFERRAFAKRELEDFEELTKIGRAIVKRLKGVPLAATVIGSLMRNKTTRRDWELVLKSETWDPEEVANFMLPALLLSYYDLPPLLKQCFAYCAVFPKDKMIPKDAIIKQWMARSFFKADGRGDMEEIGGMYFEDLVGRSLFQHVRAGYEGQIVFNIHDLVHDLAQYVAKTECYILQAENINSGPVNTRHLSLIGEYSRPSPFILSLDRNLRTLLCFDTQEAFPLDLCDNLKFLRTLELHDREISPKLLEAILKLRHLRYLDLSRSAMKELPESISCLCNLQTLKLNRCWSLSKLPDGITKLINLRHLEIEKTPSLKYLPKGIGQLSCLQTLSKFIVGGNSGLKIEELKNLNHLKGQLVLVGMERVGSANEAKDARLEMKHGLHTLFFNYYSHTMPIGGEGERVERVLESLRPPNTNLKELKVSGYMGSRLPNWMGDSSFAKLVTLKLFKCKRCIQLPALGKLPSLRTLHIDAMEEVKQIGREFYGGNYGGGKGVFPKLVELELGNMCNLEEWDLRGEDGIPCLLPLLENLELISSGKILSLPLENLPSLRNLLIEDANSIELLGGLRQLKMLQKLTIRGCPNLKCLPEDLQLTSLQELSIYSCPRLTFLPGGLQHLTSLQELRIDDCPGLTFMPQGLQHLTSLQALRIASCSGLTFLPEGLQHLTSLQELRIDYCPGLTFLPEGLQHLTSLQVLTIGSCPGLTFLPEGLQHLTSLQALRIASCPGLTCLPEGLQCLTALHDLGIYSCPGLTFLPEGLQHLTSLHYLSIDDCPGLTFLPEGLQHLISLQVLLIASCPGLTFLPEGLQHLTSGVGHLLLS